MGSGERVPLLDTSNRNYKDLEKVAQAVGSEGKCTLEVDSFLPLLHNLTFRSRLFLSDGNKKKQKVLEVTFRKKTTECKAGGRSVARANEVEAVTEKQIKLLMLLSGSIDVGRRLLHSVKLTYV